MTKYISLIFYYAQKLFKYVAEALTPLLRLLTFSRIVTRDSHKIILNSQPWSRPTSHRLAAHQWAAAHRLRTVGRKTTQKVFLIMSSEPILPLRTVTGHNGSGQNGTDKMVWTKWYTDKMALDKMVWTKWYGQNGTILYFVSI